MKFDEAYLCYDPGAGVWDDGRQGRPRGTHGRHHQRRHQDRAGAGIRVQFPQQRRIRAGRIEEVGFNPGIPIGGVVELDSFGGRFATDPTFVQANATIGVAHLLSIKGSAFAVWANPSYPYTYHPEDIVGVEELQTNTHEHPFEDFAAGAGGEVSLTPPGSARSHSARPTVCTRRRATSSSAAAWGPARTGSRCSASRRSRPTSKEPSTPATANTTSKAGSKPARISHGRSKTSVAKARASRRIRESAAVSA